MMSQPLIMGESMKNAAVKGIKRKKERKDERKKKKRKKKRKKKKIS